jgi:hypothetical protein
MDREKMRIIEERRIGAMQTLDSVMRYLKETKPSNLFLSTIEDESTSKTKSSGNILPVSEAQLQGLWQRWIGTAADILEKANQIPGLMLDDIIRLFHEENK